MLARGGNAARPRVVFWTRSYAQVLTRRAAPFFLSMETPPRTTRGVLETTPEKVVNKPPPRCSIYLPEDFVSQCEALAEIQVFLPGGGASSGLVFCAQCFARPDIQAAYGNWPQGRIQRR